MKILALISDRVLPPTNGTRVRNLHLWNALQGLGAEIRVLGLDPLMGQANIAPTIPNINSKFLPYDREPLPARAVKSLLYSYHQWPQSSSLRQQVSLVHQEWKPDIIHAEELRMSMYLPNFNNAKSSTKQTISIHNVESELIEKTGSTAFPFGRPMIEWLHMKSLKHLEAKVATLCDICFAYSAVDQEKYAKLYPEGNWKHTSGGVAVHDLESSANSLDGNSVLLVGTLNYLPNIEGLYWFIEKVLPKIVSRISLTVAGSKASEEIRAYLSKKNIKFIDTPQDLAPLYQSHQISVVPLLNGSGTRGRILESMGQGKLVVSTTIGAEGLDTKEGQGILIGDDPESFAKQIIFALEHKEARNKIALAGHEFVKSRFDWNLVAQRLISEWKAIL